MSVREFFACALSVGALLACAFVAGRCSGSTNGGNTIVERDTVTLWRVDTIREREPIFVEEVVVDTVYLYKETQPSSFDAVGGFDDREAFMRVQRQFVGEKYRAWVSGPMVGNVGPELDSLDVERDVVETTITITEKAKPKRWGLGIQAGACYDFAKKQPTPYIGVGISYNLVSW